MKMFFDTLKNRYHKNLETMKGSEPVFGLGLFNLS